jgi:hypothetical protein
MVIPTYTDPACLVWIRESNGDGDEDRLNFRKEANYSQVTNPAKSVEV